MYNIVLVKDKGFAKQEHIRFGFRGKNQTPLFMLWKEYIEYGRVVYASVIFQIG